MTSNKDHSACRKCGKIADLINGLCTYCWNKEVAPISKVNLKLPIDQNHTPTPKYTPSKLQVDDFVDKLGRKWGMWSNGWIGVID